MKTFLQFIQENIIQEENDLQILIGEATEDANIKGWMSPTGKVYLFPSDDEHCDNHHPDSKIDPYEDDPMKSVNAGLRRGYARFGCGLNQYFIHYSKKSKGGKKAAEFALKYLNPQRFSEIDVEDAPWTSKNLGDEHGGSFKSPSEAMRYIQAN